MSSTPLDVLVVSDNRSVLRETSRFLTMFGYRVQPVAGMQRARAALEARLPSILVLDAAGREQSLPELCRQLAPATASPRVCTLALAGRLTSRLAAEAMAAGVDDFLQMPLVHGELLARLRAAGRAVEQERRIARQDGVDPLTGWPNRETFQETLCNRAGDDETLACVVADLDLLERINHGFGVSAGDAVIRAAADALGALCPPRAMRAGLGGGRFGVLLLDATLEAAETWAEQARAELGKLDFVRAGATIKTTASFGVAAGQADELLGRAEEALRDAKRSGGDCVVRHGQFDEEARRWAETASSGRVFAQTAACHVMSPLPCVLQADETAARAAEVLGRTRLDAVVVVQRDGRLAGIVSRQSDLADSGRRLSKVADAGVATFDESTPLAALLQAFTEQSHLHAVVTRRGRPTGLVTLDQLARFNEPVTTDRFAPEQPYSNTSEYLVVLDRATTANTW